MVLHVIDQRSQGGKIKLGHDADVAASRVVEESEIRLSAGGVKGGLQDAKSVIVDGEHVLIALVPIAFADPGRMIDSKWKDFAATAQQGAVRADGGRRRGRHDGQWQKKGQVEPGKRDAGSEETPGKAHGVKGERFIGSS